MKLVASRSLFLGALVGVLAACGSAAPDDSRLDPGQAGAGGAGATGPGGGSTAGSSTGGFDSGGAGGFNAGGSGQVSDCETGIGQSIFVVSSEKALLSFDPLTSKFTLIGTLACPAGALSSPFSMAVARTGTAFVLYDNGNIFKVSTKDASCTTSGFKPNQGGFKTFGMGYVSDAAGSNGETLFIMDGSAAGVGSNKGLASVSGAGAVTPIGQFDGGLAGRSGEVTGTGDGRLFGFFVDITSASKTSVAEIDKTTGHVLSNVPQTLPTINAWAFAHWGGSFYLFNGNGSSPSRVDKYTPGVGTKQVVANAGYRIVGAGVSTCAPVVEPK